jgi:hypothetical protein
MGRKVVKKRTNKTANTKKVSSAVPWFRALAFKQLTHCSSLLMDIADAVDQLEEEQGLDPDMKSNIPEKIDEFLLHIENLKASLY